MPKIAFYIDLKRIQVTLEGADLDKGNPGVGGTEYLFLLAVKALNKLHEEDYSILLTNIHFKNADPDLMTDYVPDEQGAVHYCESHAIQNLVFTAVVVGRANPKVFDTSVDILLWSHNVLNSNRQRFAAETRSIKWVVCVSESQYNNMADTPCFYKCTFINNFISDHFYEHARVSDYSEQKAVYVGSLYPHKGAHNLLEIWKHVEKRLPHAQLYIIGGANVWYADAVLGSAGLADPYYERVLQKRLDRLSHPKNIHFMGAEGWGHIDSFISTFRLGIVNPSHYARDETFCLSAIELATHGLPIVSRQRNDGLATTVLSGKTGFLEKTDKAIANKIVSILSNPKMSGDLGMAGRAYAQSFTANNVVSKWCELTESSRKNGQNNRIASLSRDSLLLRRDSLLRRGYQIESGWVVDYYKKKLRGR